jgi:outer membrane protein
MNIRSAKDAIKIIVLCTLLLLFVSGTAFSITLEEAIKRATDVSYVLKEQKEIVKRSRFSYISTIDAYLPRADIQSSYTRSLSSQSIKNSTNTSSSIDIGDSRDMFAFAGILSYRLFDGGERYAKRKGAFSLLEREQERLKGVQEDVLFNVKNTFFTALGKKFILEKRQEALESTEKIFKLTKGRYEEGITKKSDVLQAEVRLLTAKIQLYEAIKEYEKALEDFSSLLILKPDEKIDVDGILEKPKFSDSSENLVERATKVRPDVTAQTREVDRLNMVYRERKSNWFPRIDTELQQSRQDKRFFPEGRSDSFMVNFTFPLFDGVGRYYNMMGALSDVAAAKHRLEETKRNVKLDIIKAFKDYELSTEDVRMYEELVREATTNFEQAFGEYKVGKGDILTLLQSEKDLATAKENYISSIYKANTALAYLEKVAYIGKE